MMFLQNVGKKVGSTITFNILRMSSGNVGSDIGSGVGRGGGAGGSIREGGGAFGKLEAAREEEYFYKLVCFFFLTISSNNIHIYHVIFFRVKNKYKKCTTIW